jgi:hypothetical protein
MEWSLRALCRLAGYPAFAAETEPALYKKIIALDYKLNIEPWDKISDGGMHLSLLPQSYF